MFEATLEAQALNAGENRFRSLSTAVLAHAAIVGTIVTIASLIVPKVIVPEPKGIEVVLPRNQGFDKAMGPHDPPPPIKKSAPTTAANHEVSVVPKPIEPPTQTPTTLATAAPPSDADNDLPGEGDPDGDENGTSRGVLGGTGKPAGGGEGEGEGSGDPLHVTGDMVRPVLLSKVEPVYPNAARMARLQGRVVMEAVIGLEGRVESATVLSSTNSLFDEAALAAVRQWRYSPASMNGGPVRVYFTVQVSFVLR